ncbi:hypothetical protein NMY22_g3783 [Coprinellus aureogranulatus]|nr:hypothetical protein NMY22_g3783 [Coprinellus aureogranulatus]
MHGDHHYYQAPVNVVGVANNANFGINHGSMIQRAHQPENALSVRGGDIFALLNPIEDASHTRNLRLSPPNSQCFPGTRKAVLDDIRAWADSDIDPSEPHIMWVYGYAGCGKSAIAQEIATEFDDGGLLAASFFFFRGTGDRSRIVRFACTVASQLAASIPATEPIIEAAVRKNRGLLSSHTASPSRQFERLVYHPTMEVASLLSRPVLIVLDGVDECGDWEEMSTLIEDMISFFDTHPNSPLRILITSRVEDHLHQQLQFSNQVKLLNLVDRTSDADIAAALDIEIEKRKGSRLLVCDKSWPSWWDKQQLVKHIGGSFIFMTTVLKHLFDSNLKDGLTPMQRLPLVLTMQPDFDSLYKSILEPCQHLPYFHNILCTIVLVQRPVSISEIAGLLELTTTNVVNVLVNLHAIMQVPGDDRTSVTLWHTSLRDFLTTLDRAGPFFVNPRYHRVIGSSCLRLIDSSSSHMHEYSRDYAIDHVALFTQAMDGDPINIHRVFPGLTKHLQDAVFKDGQTPLEIATMGEHWKLVCALVNGGANVNVCFKGKERSGVVTALHAACHRKEFNMVYFLLENGADPNVSGELDPFAHLAKVAEQMVQVLTPANYNSEFNCGTPLAFASSRGDIKLVTHLLECGADPNLQGGYYGTALQVACRSGKLEVANLLLEHGADPNLTGGNYGSALHACAWHDQVDSDCAQALLEHKADPNVRDQDGDTPLGDACLQGHTKVAELLLDFGADPTIRNKAGDTALQRRIKWCGEDSDVVRMLCRRGVTE